MRLICGIVRFDGAPVQPAVLRAMIEALGARGLAPTISERVDDAAALAVLDFDPACAATSTVLPVSADGRWLAADARIDRQAALASALGLSGASSPNDVILAAVERWGADLPDRMDGDFALAVWEPLRRRILCARDLAGARPLCYAHEPGQWFAFASLPRGLHASGVVAARPDFVALGRMLVDVWPDISETGYRDIQWLRAGHTLSVTPDATRLHHAWQPNVNNVGTWRGTAADAAATLRALIQDAVASRVADHTTVASDLSGGLDSSCVAVIAARTLRARGRRLVAFSQLAGRSQALDLMDERRYVDAILAQESDIAWSAVYLPSIDLTQSMNVDAPGTIAGMTPPDMTCAAAAAAGATLLLTGSGGDEGATYNGAGLHAAMLRQGHWFSLPAEIRDWARRRGTSVTRAAVNRVIYPLAPSGIIRVSQRLRGRAKPPVERSLALGFLSPPIARQVEAALPQQQRDLNRPRDRIEKLARGYLATRATFWSVIGAAHGVAFTHPLMDRRVLDFMLSLPINRLAAGGWTRQPFRDAMAGILPDEVRWRDGKFVPYPDAALRAADAKSHLISQIEQLRRSPAVETFVDLDAIDATIRAIPDGDAARALARKVNREGDSSTVSRFMGAVRATAIASHVARNC